MPVLNTVLIGMMGAGKSTVGRLLAARTGRPFSDTDELVEAAVGCSISELWQRRGEDAFRSLEAQAVAEVASADGQVVAVGGGAVLRPDNVAALRATGRLVYLRARPETLRARVGQAGGRPLAARLETLAAEREATYLSAADLVVDTDDLSADAVAERLARRVTVAVAGRAYDVVVGGGALEELPAVRAAVVAPARVREVHGEAVEKALGGAVWVDVPDGEAAKTPAVLAHVWNALAAAGVGRDDVVVGLGGGATTDLAGFAAATYLRGVPWIAVPTTVLGMVDAAIGGKTAVDLAHGKNLAGAVWQPSLVICDTNLLATLPEREVRSGWAEVTKYGFIADPAILDECVSGARLPSDDLVRRCVAIKAEVVAADEREGHRRMWLNYGHTVGHAVELASGMSLSHGEAVAVGLVAAAELGAMAGFADVREVTTQVVERLGLPSHASGLDRAAVESAMAADKKRGAQGLRFVVLEALGRPVVVDEADLPRGALPAALDAVLR